MAMTEKIVLLICLFGGFYWLRARTRSVDLENQMLKAVLGVFVLLPAILVGEKYLFEMFHFGIYTDILLKAALILATFPAIGFGFLRGGAIEGSTPTGPAGSKE
jgi:hypothetical protein